MLVFGSALTATPILSVQTGRAVARVSRPLIDPRDLTITAYWCEETIGKNKSKLLLVTDIREHGSIGFIIDSADELVDPKDVVVIEKLIKINFKLIGLDVITEDGHKIGKVEDYSLDTKNFVIEQVKVKKPLMKSFSETSFLINRNQIIEVTDYKLIVKSSREKQESSPKLKQKAFINPFATSGPQTETSEFSE